MMTHIYIYIYTNIFKWIYVNVYEYVNVFLYVQFRDLESGLSKDLKDGEPCLRRANAGGARGDTDVHIVRYAWV